MCGMGVSLREESKEEEEEEEKRREENMGERGRQMMRGRHEE